MRVFKLFGRTGALSAIVAAMGCASCFPALGTLIAAIGLGCLAQFEGVFINTLLPVFAAIALAANLLAWFSLYVWPLVSPDHRWYSPHSICSGLTAGAPACSMRCLR